MDNTGMKIYGDILFWTNNWTKQNNWMIQLIMWYFINNKLNVLNLSSNIPLSYINWNDLQTLTTNLYLSWTLTNYCTKIEIDDKTWFQIDGWLMKIPNENSLMIWTNNIWEYVDYKIINHDFWTIISTS